MRSLILFVCAFIMLVYVLMIRFLSDLRDHYHYHPLRKRVWAIPHPAVLLLHAVGPVCRALAAKTDRSPRVPPQQVGGRLQTDSLQSA